MTSIPAFRVSVYLSCLMSNTVEESEDWEHQPQLEGPSLDVADKS